MPQNKISIPFQTLSPIWTGNAERKTSYIKEISIIGGIRFWTAATLRSLGKRVCNDQRCNLEKDQKIEDVCASYQIFGCTGLGRSFSLNIVGKTDTDKIGRIELN